MLSSLPGAAVTSVKIKGVIMNHYDRRRKRGCSIPYFEFEMLRVKIHQGEKHKLTINVKGLKQ